MSRSVYRYNASLCYLCVSLTVSVVSVKRQEVTETAKSVTETSRTYRNFTMAVLYDFATISFHLVLFSAAQVELAKSNPVLSLILTSHLFFCLPFLLFPFTVPCRIIFTKPIDLETCQNHLSFCFLTKVRGSSYSPMAVWIFLQPSLLVS